MLGNKSPPKRGAQTPTVCYLAGSVGRAGGRGAGLARRVFRGCIVCRLGLCRLQAGLGLDDRLAGRGPSAAVGARPPVPATRPSPQDAAASSPSRAIPGEGRARCRWPFVPWGLPLNSLCQKQVARGTGMQPGLPKGGGRWAYFEASARHVALTSSPAEVCRAAPQAPAPRAWPRRHTQASRGPGAFSGPSHRPESQGHLGSARTGSSWSLSPASFPEGQLPKRQPLLQESLGKSVKYLPLPRDLHVHPQALPEGHCPCR